LEGIGSNLGLRTTMAIEDDPRGEESHRSGQNDRDEPTQTFSPFEHRRVGDEVVHRILDGRDVARGSNIDKRGKC
jgi:hypothetical protein